MQWIPDTNLTACVDLCCIFKVQLPHVVESGFYSIYSGVTVTTHGTRQLKNGVEEGAVNADESGLANPKCSIKAFSRGVVGGKGHVLCFGMGYLAFWKKQIRIGTVWDGDIHN